MGRGGRIADFAKGAGEGGGLLDEPGGGGEGIIVKEPNGVAAEAEFVAVNVAAPFAVIDEGVDELAEGGVLDLGGDVVSEAEGAAVPVFGESAGEAPGGIGS